LAESTALCLKLRRKCCSAWECCNAHAEKNRRRGFHQPNAMPVEGEAPEAPEGGKKEQNRQQSAVSEHFCKKMHEV